MAWLVGPRARLDNLGQGWPSLPSNFGRAKASFMPMCPHKLVGTIIVGPDEITNVRWVNDGVRLMTMPASD